MVASESTLENCDFSGTDLSYADLSVIYIATSKLRDANFSYATLCEVYVGDSDLSNANLSYARMLGVDGWKKADLSSINFTKAIYTSYTEFPTGFNPSKAGAIFICAEADLSGLDLKNVNLGYEELCGANLSHANLSGARLYNTDLRAANLSYANLEGVDFHDADLSEANFSHANLKKAKLAKADLNDAIFCNTIMPNGRIKNNNC
ncbi:pentapeptide repeat-containing protein [Moorena sp. SIO2C4]|uniref:pentapeptide repeat-containing protein n=1 Tax=Moorena sp. SIO2C4 TaxID=2607824 RepID=UPI00338F320F